MSELCACHECVYMSESSVEFAAERIGPVGWTNKLGIER